MPSAETARLVAELTLDDKKFSPAMARATKATGSLDKALGRAGQGISTASANLARMGAIGGGLVVAGLAASVVEASNLNEELSKSSVVFGKASAEVIAFSETTAKSLGLAQSEALGAAGAFGNMFKTTGIAEEAAADMSTTMVTLAADMASFNNEDPSDMLDRLRSGLSGEAEPLRRFGVLLSEAAVKAEAYATGIAKDGEALTEAQKVQARYSLILKQTAVQQGDFSRTSGSLANQQRILRASLRDTGAAIGTALLPKITEMAVKLNKLIVDNQPAILAFADKLPGAFDKVVAFAERIPWATIGSGLEKAAFFAEKLFDIFLGLPPEVQTTLIALAGLNKLSGGAITGVVSELGKGLIKGVLGMTAGVVNLKAGTVIGGGGPGAPGRAGAAGSGLVSTATQVILPVAIATAVQAGAKEGILQATGSQAAAQAQQAVGGGPTNLIGPLDRLFRALGGDFRSDLEVVQDLEREQLAAANKKATADAVNAQQILRASERADQQRKEQTQRITGGLAPIRSEMIRVREAQRTAGVTLAAKIGAGTAEQVRIKAAIQSQKAEQARTTEAARSAAAAIRDKRFTSNVTVNVNNKVWVGETIKSQTTFKKLGGFVAS